MGRYDALTQLEEKNEKTTPIRAVPSTNPDTSQTQTIHKEKNQGKKPANPQTRKTANPLARKPAKLHIEFDNLEKPEKYTTRLLPSLVKKVRLHAIDKEVKDYEVVSIALNEYFERNK